MKTAKIDAILEHYGSEASHIIAILQDVQGQYKYLPRPVLEYVADKVSMPVSQIYHLATFFAAFSLEPQGKHLVHVCMGTACHVRGAPLILGSLERKLEVAEGGTTTDGNFTLKRVNCLGSCALGPLVTVDEKYYGRATSAKMNKIVDSYVQAPAAKAAPKGAAKKAAKPKAKAKTPVRTKAAAKPKKTAKTKAKKAATKAAPKKKAAVKAKAKASVPKKAAGKKSTARKGATKKKAKS